ncbi:hypothetical protein [Nocardia sp. No.11]|uniref:hypothetical protein n=1 Tax=Nocardia sp. No.11 TaxID=3128861 RepID=UPI00319DD190
MNDKNSTSGLLKSAGMIPISVDLTSLDPSVLQTWQLVSTVGVEPDVIVPFDEGAGAVTDPWIRALRRRGIPSNEGIFLIAVNSAHVISKAEWAAVRVTESVDLARIADSRGRLEFVSRSLNGEHYCGVTGEEDGHWLVTGDYPETPRQTWIDMTAWPPVESATISEILRTFRADENIPQLKIAVAKVLHQIYDRPISAAREVTNCLDESLRPTVSDTELEDICPPDSAE